MLLFLQPPPRNNLCLLARTSFNICVSNETSSVNNKQGKSLKIAPVIQNASLNTKQSDYKKINKIKK